VSLAIKRPRTKSTAARQVSNVHERDLVTNHNVLFRPFLGQTYLLESIFSDAFLGAALTRVMRAGVPIPAVAAASVLHSAAVGGSVAGDAGPL